MKLTYKPVKNCPINIGIAIEITSISVSFAQLLHCSTSGLGNCFHFRFVPDGVLHSRAVMTQAKVDRACPKTVVAAEITLKCLYVYFRFW